VVAHRRWFTVVLALVFGATIITTEGASAQGGPGPLCQTGCIQPSPVLVTPQGTYTDTLITGGGNVALQFTVKNIGSYWDTYNLIAGCNACTVVSQTLTSVGLGPGASANMYVTISPGPANTTGNANLLATDSAGCGGGLRPSSGATPSGPAPGPDEAFTCYQSTGYYNIVNVPGPAPIVSLAPYSAGLDLATTGVTYDHSLPAFGSMEVSRSLTLAYNSAAARPMSFVTVDVSNPSSPYPTTYQLQVQLASNSVYLQLMNGSTSVYYTAGTTTTTRMVAAIDAKANGLTTGWYPVNIVVTSNYGAGPRTVTVTSRLLVNDQTGGSFGAGVGLVGVPRLYSMPGSYGLLLVGGGGAVDYFDRTCSTCGFVSPGGESGTLAVYNDPVLGQLYRLTALGGSIEDFGTNGRVLRSFVLASIQDRTFTWTDTLLTSVTDASGRGFTLTYSGGKLTQISDPAARVTGVSIVGGQLLGVTDPDNLSESLVYGANSLLTQVTDRAGGMWNFTYNGLNQQGSVTGPAATDYTGASVRPVTSDTTQDLVIWQPGTPGTSASAPKNNVKPDTVMGFATDPLGNVTRAAVDRFGLPVRVVDALAETTTVTRDTLGNATSIQRPDGHLQQFTYSRYLLSQSSDLFTGEILNYTYNASNQVIAVTGGPAEVDYSYHDGSQGPAGTLKQVLVGHVVQAQHFPNAYGQDTLVLDGLGHKTQSVYAAAAAGGNLLQAIDPKAHVTSFHYNAFGFADTTTLMTGYKQAAAYDALNRDTIDVNELGYKTHYLYSALGLTRIADPKGQVYKFDLNAWGSTVAQHDLADTTRVDSLKYDATGRLRTVKTRRGDTITLTYDALGRLLTRSGPDFPQESFSYGILTSSGQPNGSWAVAANANGRDSVAYDKAGRPVFSSQRMPDGVTTYQMSYTYDANHRLINRSAPTGGSVARWVYNGVLGTLDTLCQVATCVRFGRDTERKADTITYNAGQASPWSQVQTFDSMHMVTRDSFGISQLYSDFGSTWYYDSLGELTAARTNNMPLGPEKYYYDPVGRLVNACAMNVINFCGNEYSVYGGIAYSYDSAGNRTDTLFANAIIGAGNRTQRFKGYALSYDLNGGLLAKSGLGASDPWNRTDTTTFQWNAQGELTRVEKWPAGGAHTVTTFAYDALGRRVGKTVNGVTTWFLYDSDQLIMDVNAASGAMAAEYGYFEGSNLLAIRTPSWTGIALKDPVAHGVIGVAAAQGGTEIKNYGISASPWGEVASDTGTVVRFRLGSQEYDQETGLYHLGARYYDPQLGRFMSEDPSGIAGGLNLYTYAGNDPVDRHDPTGLDDLYCTSHLEFDGITYEYEPTVTWETWHWILVTDCSPTGAGGGAGAGGGEDGAPISQTQAAHSQTDVGEQAERACRNAILMATGDLALDIATFGKGAAALRAARSAALIDRAANKLAYQGLWWSSIAARGAAQTRAQQAGASALGAAGERFLHAGAGQTWGAAAGEAPSAGGFFKDLLPLRGFFKQVGQALDACFPD
jgi:RHS repeat-associated protein